MNPFERHCKEHLSGPARTPEWIKRAKKNGAAKVRRWMKRYNLTREEAKEAISEDSTNRSQAPD